MQELLIVRSESFNYHGNYRPENAYDNNYNTQYSVKDNEVAGNYLKLYLSQVYSISQVKMTVRGDCCKDRIVNTEALVYDTMGGIEALEMGTCGIIASEKCLGT